MLDGCISEDDFAKACQRLAKCAATTDNLDGITINLSGTNILTVTRASKNPLPMQEEAEDQSLDCPDEAAIHPIAPLTKASEITYHIIYSPTYRVPVIYFFIPDGSMDIMYENLVPKHQHDVLKNIGVMGAIGMTNHPVTDVPCFWVHPCQTAEAVGTVTRTWHRKPAADDYLMLWIGLVAASVGLSLPRSLAVAYMESSFD